MSTWWRHVKSLRSVPRSQDLFVTDIKCPGGCTRLVQATVLVFFSRSQALLNHSRITIGLNPSKRCRENLSSHTSSGSSNDGKLAHTCAAPLPSLCTKENSIEIKALLSSWISCQLPETIDCASTTGAFSHHVEQR